jgi:hypothetical protein
VFFDVNLAKIRNQNHSGHVDWRDNNECILEVKVYSKQKVLQRGSKLEVVVVRALALVKKSKTFVS